MELCDKGVAPRNPQTSAHASSSASFAWISLCKILLELSRRRRRTLLAIVYHYWDTVVPNHSHGLTVVIDIVPHRCRDSAVDRAMNAAVDPRSKKAHSTCDNVSKTANTTHLQSHIETSAHATDDRQFSRPMWFGPVERFSPILSLGAKQYRQVLNLGV